VAPNLLENTHFSAERGIKIMNYAPVFVFIREAVYRVEFVSDRMSYIILEVAGLISMF
jgi:hypothetical protein